MIEFINIIIFFYFCLLGQNTGNCDRIMHNFHVAPISYFYYSNALYACIGASNCSSVFLFGIFGLLKVLAFNFIPFVTVFPYCLCLILICFYPNDLAIWLIIPFQM
jgi:hypothetical protein